MKLVTRYLPNLTGIMKGHYKEKIQPWHLHYLW